MRDKTFTGTFFYDTVIAALIYAFLVVIYVFGKSRLSVQKTPEQK